MVAILAALAVAWTAVILLAPWLPVPAAGVVYLLGGRLCHQIPERSFHLHGAQLPVCARCVGIYMGAALTLLCACGANPTSLRALRFGGPPKLQRRRKGSRHKYLLLGALAINGLTLILEWVGVWTVPNVVRAAAGAGLGIAVALAIGTIDYEEWPSPRRITSALPDSRI